MAKHKKHLLPLTVAFSVLSTLVAIAAEPARIDGKWFAYPGQVDPLQLTIEPPPPIPEPPLKPEYLAQWRALRAEIQAAEQRGEPIASGYTHCIPDGMPTMMQGMFPMEVLESEGQVTIIQEAYQQVRRIYLDDEQQPWEEAEPRFWGHSVARWEGDTLVVDTVGIKENVMFRNVPHSPAMRISERIRLIDDMHMVDEVTVTDPEYLTGPWQWTWMYARNPDYKLYEYVCENNREYADPETGEARLRLFGE
ncbi:MAG: hypothetical protein RLZZ227_419 [Pseudomonadota bacterium]|jgi:hypothetical protein